jgi:hypothetical protein
MTDPGAERVTRQFTLRTLFAVVLLCALLLSLWKVGGGVSVRLALVVGMSVGILMSILRKRDPLMVVAAVAGAIVGTILGLHVVDIDIGLYNSPQPKPQYGERSLSWWAFGGAMLGAIVVMLRSWRLTRSIQRDRKE